MAIGNGMTGKYHFKFENYQAFLDVLNGNTGVIMIGAHVGNWEIGAPFFDEYGKKINIVMFDAEHKRIKEILEKNASTRDYKIIPVNEDSLTHVFRITEALDRREYVCFQGDRYLNKEKLLTTSFMGKEAKFPMGPFLLASKLKVPVVFYFAMREAQRTYRFHFFIAETVVRTKRETGRTGIIGAIYTNAGKDCPAVSGTMVQLLPVLDIKNKSGMMHKKIYKRTMYGCRSAKTGTRDSFRSCGIPSIAPDVEIRNFPIIVRQTGKDIRCKKSAGGPD